MTYHPGLPSDVDHGRDLDLRAHAGSLMRRWRTLLAILAAFLALGGAIILLTPAVFTAETTLEIDREGPKITPIGEAAPVVSLLGADEFYQTQYGLLRGRALAARVAQTLRLDHDTRFIAAMGERADQFAAPRDRDKRSSEVIRLLRRHARITPLRGSRLVTIAFSSPRAELSAGIARAFVAAFIESGLERRVAASNYARDYLGRQLATARAALESNERGLADYASTQGVIPLPGPVAGRSLTAASLETFNSALDAARGDRILAEQHWRQAQVAGLAAPEVLASPTVQLISQNRAKLAADYEDRLSVYKPDYPDMRQLKARMDETDRQLAREAGAILESLHARYAASLGAEAALSGRVEALKAGLIALRMRGIGYGIRDREVDADRAVYDGLLQRYQDVGIASGAAPGNIIVVDPATVPDKPSWPRPWLIMLLAALAGLVSGIGAVLLPRKTDGEPYPVGPPDRRFES
jgi:succinoglycan biosynthesis transport protein ExoP